LSRLREEQPALRFGRLYFRQVSGNGRDFGYSSGAGGLVAFSRVVSDIEVLVIANTGSRQRFDGHVLQDPDLNRHPRKMHVAYSNLGTVSSATVRRISDARFFSSTALAAGPPQPCRLTCSMDQVLSEQRFHSKPKVLVIFCTTIE
jgi:hypothetical protein